MTSLEIFSSTWLATRSPLHRLLETPQAIRDDPALGGSHAGVCTGGRNCSNYPLPDAVVDVIDRL